MKTKYEKPSAQSLGNLYSTAQGYCIAGSTAATVPPDSDCISGLYARGGLCNRGDSNQDTNVCRTGTHPAYLGCENGLFANSGSCHTGQYAG